jgi:hypothetical protein
LEDVVDGDRARRSSSFERTRAVCSELSFDDEARH